MSIFKHIDILNVLICLLSNILILMIHSKERYLISNILKNELNVINLRFSIRSSLSVFRFNTE